MQADSGPVAPVGAVGSSGNRPFGGNINFNSKLPEWSFFDAHPALTQNGSLKNLKTRFPPFTSSRAAISESSAMNNIRIPDTLQSVRPEALEDYVRQRLGQFVGLYTRRIIQLVPPGTISREGLEQAAFEVVESMPVPEFAQIALESRELQLVFRHDCMALGCLDPQCALCQHNPNRRCLVNFDRKYLVNDVLKAKCGATIRVELIDRQTGVQVDDDMLELRLEMFLLDGNLYDTKFLEGTKDGSEVEDDSDTFMLLLNKKKNGKGILPDLHVTDSSEAILSGRKPPFRLLVRAMLPENRPNLKIRHAISEGFVVATRRTRTAGKLAKLTSRPQVDDLVILVNWSVEDHVSKLEHMGKETVKKLQDIRTVAQQAGVEIDIPENTILKHVLKLSKEKWDEARDHAMRAVVGDGRMRAWYADRQTLEIGLLFATRLGCVDLDRPVALLQHQDVPGPNHATETKVQATLMAQQTPAQRDLVRQLQPQGAHSWWLNGHPGWAIFPMDSDQFLQSGGLLESNGGFESSPESTRHSSEGGIWQQQQQQQLPPRLDPPLQALPASPMAPGGDSIHAGGRTLPHFSIPQQTMGPPPPVQQGQYNQMGQGQGQGPNPGGGGAPNQARGGARGQVKNSPNPFAEVAIVKGPGGMPMSQQPQHQQQGMNLASPTNSQQSLYQAYQQQYNQMQVGGSRSEGGYPTPSTSAGGGGGGGGGYPARSTSGGGGNYAVPSTSAGGGGGGGGGMGNGGGYAQGPAASASGGGGAVSRAPSNSSGGTSAQGGPGGGARELYSPVGGAGGVGGGNNMANNMSNNMGANTQYPARGSGGGGAGGGGGGGYPVPSSSTGGGGGGSGYPVPSASGGVGAGGLPNPYGAVPSSSSRGAGGGGGGGAGGLPSLYNGSPMQARSAGGGGSALEASAAHGRGLQSDNNDDDASGEPNPFMSFMHAAGAAASGTPLMQHLASANMDSSPFGAAASGVLLMQHLTSANIDYIPLDSSLFDSNPPAGGGAGMAIAKGGLPSLTSNFPLSSIDLENAFPSSLLGGDQMETSLNSGMLRDLGQGSIEAGLLQQLLQQNQGQMLGLGANGGGPLGQPRWGSGGPINTVTSGLDTMQSIEEALDSINK
eukprot:gene11523-34235_t